ncbi:serine hydrolase domain-containing protein [Lacimicrobium alkaliphilum]|uniref:Beta-lactamase-related domain-containing protein n=1 Tax=Lacimicrobium alkaliphilum TaxID=1526571 RepID=A0A0U2ZFL2_9ALTE|nr:serine hydrolase domain-containing protein [Lacimicrobium alkaliphilum]ALS97879.1 hypothetical protein AT746_06080 [Lacimicrobium alkaliphilum]
MTRLIQSLFLLLSLLLISQVCAGQPVPDNLEDLGQTIDKIRSDTKTPGIAVSLLLADGNLWFHSSGFANLNKRTRINQDTQFRFGSVSKMLVSLSVLKLVDQGVLNLDDKVADLVPEVYFDNPWQVTHPLTVAHLLNHTSGWDAPHFAEQISVSDKPVSIKHALEIHPHSRTSRWPPGTRSAYNNTGPLVAAYIVEKYTGQTYESFVKEQFFTPLSMKDSDYFYTDHYRTHAATFYQGTSETPYWHLNNRAAGALNSSLADMGKFLAFLLRRDQSPALLSEQALNNFQQPQASLATSTGLQLTWALGNNLYHANGQVLYGHQGSLPGASAMVVYQPALNSGYVIAANTGGPGVSQVHKLLADFITRSSNPPVVKPERMITDEDKRLSGFYRNISPVAELTDSFMRLIPWSLRVTEQNTLLSIPFAGPKRQLVANATTGFKQQSTGKVVLVQAEDPVVGDVLHYGPHTLKKVSVPGAYLPRIVLVLWLVSILLGLAFALIWIPRKWMGKINNSASLRIRSWPMITLIPLVIVVACLLMIKSSATPFVLAGQPTVLSLIVFFASIVFFLAALWSVRIWYLIRNDKMGRLVRWHSGMLIFLNLVIALYLLSQGLIGVRLWG